MTCCNYQRCGLLNIIVTLPKSGNHYGTITVEMEQREGSETNPTVLSWWGILGILVILKMEQEIATG